jgi:hypothetical protein
MDTLNPELKKFLQSLPLDFGKMQQDAHGKFKIIEEKLDEAVYVNLANGDGNRVKIANIIPKMHKDIQDIKDSTEFLRDFQKLHYLLKKYKLYWIIGFMGMLVMGLGIKDIVMEATKGLIK